jgi:hypothetical protein
MPLEPDDLRISPAQENLNRQLEALQRYVSGVQHQRDQAKAPPVQPPPAPERRRPSRLWLLVTGVLVALGLVTGLAVGAVAWSDARPTGAGGVSSPTQGPATTIAPPAATPACKTAVDRANAMLAIVVGLRRQLAEYDRIMGDPSSRTLSGRQLVDKTAPVLRSGADQAARFDQALAAYRQVVDQCRLQAP